MTNYEKSIEFLNQLGAKKDLFYNISLYDYKRVTLQGRLTSESRKALSDLVNFELSEKRNWLQGETIINNISVEITLTF